jgi:V-type H+-transporting ATPase subunit H
MIAVGVANSTTDILVESYVSWLCKELGTKGTSKLASCLTGMMAILGIKRLRPMVIRNLGLKSLSGLLKQSSLKAQTIYQVMFCVWTLTYVTESSREFLKSGGEDVISGIALVLQNASKEKIIRVGVNALKNLLGQPGVNVEMIECKLLKFLITLSARTWSDTDILDDINAVVEGLQKDYQVFSSFDRYSKEITSGALEWGPVHTEAFWKDNVTRMEKDDFKLIRILVSLLDPNNAATVIAVACYDIGEFIRYYPNGKTIIKSFGGKTLIMNLLEHKDNGVKSQALLCCSKMMVQNWDFLESTK